MNAEFYERYFMNDPSGFPELDEPAPINRNFTER